MKIVQINTSYNVGSTGKICLSISDLLTSKEIDNYVFFTNGVANTSKEIKYASAFYLKLQALKSRIFGNYGFNSKSATKKLIKKLDEIKPNIIHLHNLHGHNVHLEVLFEYIRENNIKTFWTFHDCWAFTAYCPHYAMVKCDKWKTLCYNCVRHKEFSWFFDKSKKLYNKKKEATKNIDLTIITPSKWLADQVKESFLKDYPVKVINNGIHLDIFKPTESNFREKYGLENKKIVLGSSYYWNERKGLDVFEELSKRLPDNYQIVLVGLDKIAEKKLNERIIKISRTNDQRFLAELYSVADVFANPTKEETFGMVNVESLACGTPVVMYNAGGSPECIDETCGSVVEIDDIDTFEKEIIRICNNKPYSKEACIARANNFDEGTKIKEHIDLYLQ